MAGGRVPLSVTTISSHGGATLSVAAGMETEVSETRALVVMVQASVMDIL